MAEEENIYSRDRYKEKYNELLDKYKKAIGKEQNKIAREIQKLYMRYPKLKTTISKDKKKPIGYISQQKKIRRTIPVKNKIDEIYNKYKEIVRKDYNWKNPINDKKAIKEREEYKDSLIDIISDIDEYYNLIPNVSLSNDKNELNKSTLSSFYKNLYELEKRLDKDEFSKVVDVYNSVMTELRKNTKNTNIEYPRITTKAINELGKNNDLDTFLSNVITDESTYNIAPNIMGEIYNTPVYENEEEELPEGLSGLTGLFRKKTLSETIKKPTEEKSSEEKAEEEAEEETEDEYSSPLSDLETETESDTEHKQPTPLIYKPTSEMTSGDYLRDFLKNAKPAFSDWSDSEKSETFQDSNAFQDPTAFQESESLQDSEALQESPESVRNEIIPTELQENIEQNQQQQLAILQNIEDIVKNIQEKPLEKTLTNLSELVPLVNIPELSDKLDSYLVDKLSTLEDYNGNPLFRDQQEVMNFIKVLKNGNQIKYKLPIKVNKQIERETQREKRINPMISKTIQKVSHNKSQFYQF